MGNMVHHLRFSYLGCNVYSLDQHRMFMAFDVLSCGETAHSSQPGLIGSIGYWRPYSLIAG